MLVEQQELLLADHADMRVVPLDADETPADRNKIVQLSPDHPGFRDPEYRARRNRIAQLALSYQPGQPIPEAPYSTEEHEVWRAVWKALGPAHQAHACAEYLACLRQLAFAPDRIPQLREDGAVKAYGTGLLSSAGELEAMHNAELRPLDLEKASRHEYDPTHYQPVLFCADSFESMFGSLRQFLIAW